VYSLITCLIAVLELAQYKWADLLYVYSLITCLIAVLELAQYKWADFKTLRLYLFAGK